MKRRILTLLAACALLLALTACGGTEDPAGETEDATQETTAQPEGEEPVNGDAEMPEEEPPAENPAAQDDAQTDAAGDSGNSASSPGTGTTSGASGGGTSGGSQNTSSQKPAAEPPAQTAPPAQDKPAEDTVSQPAQPQAEEPAADGVDLQAFYDSLAATESEWPSMTAMEGESLDAFYPGLSDISTKQCLVNMAMISASGVEIALVEVSDSADVQAVKDIFQARIDYQVGDGESPGGAWYPEPTEMWRSSSRIVSNGNCVMLVAFQNADSVVEAFNALFA